MREVPPIVETLAGVVLVAVAASQLVAGAQRFPSFAETLVMLVLLLVGIALIYLGFERHRDGKRADGRSRHSRDDERW